MKHFIFFLFIVISVVSCASHKERFSVKAPVGWLRSDSIVNGDTVSVKMNPDVVPAHRNINIYRYPSKDLDLFIHNTLSGEKKLADFYKFTGNGTTEIKNYTFKWVQHIIRLKNKRDTVEQKVYFSKSPRFIYMIVCNSTPEKFPGFTDKIDLVLNSFTISD